MFRAYRIVLVAAAVLTLFAGESRAQYRRYGGWGGWGGGSTVQGDVARGLGFYYQGLGNLNRNTAIANSINANTMRQWNQYLWLSQQEANRREYLRMARRQQRDSQSGALIYQRLHDNPSAADIDDGDALNVILDEITDPRIHSSALRLATAPIEAKVIQQIPFENASEAVTLSLHQLAATDVWPLALRGEDFRAAREGYQQAAAEVLKEDKEGDLQAATIQRVRDAIARVRAQLERTPHPDRGEYLQAENYIKTLTGMARMLDQPQVEKVLGELESIQSTTLGSLLGFMHTYNLRFGPATTPEQRAIYQQLYPILAAQRDRTVREAGVDISAPPPPIGHPINMLQDVHLDHLEGKAPAAPR